MRTHLDTVRFDRELARRGLDGRRLAHLAHVSEATICRARTGRAVDVRTLQRVAQALLHVPPIAGAEDLLLTPSVQVTAER